MGNDFRGVKSDIPLPVIEKSGPEMGMKVRLGGGGVLILMLPQVFWLAGKRQAVQPFTTYCVLLYWPDLCFQLYPV